MHPLPPLSLSLCFFFNDTATTEIYTLSLHDALPISRPHLSLPAAGGGFRRCRTRRLPCPHAPRPRRLSASGRPRSEEHTCELQSRRDLVCRLLLEKKKKKTKQ